MIALAGNGYQPYTVYDLTRDILLEILERQPPVMTAPDDSESAYLSCDLVEQGQIPLISVALLVRNGGEHLRELVSRLTSQRGGAPFEIVVVDSGSTDGSLDVLKQHGVRVASIDVSEFKFGTARQLAFSLTRGKAIVTTSQDTLPQDEFWLRDMTDPILAGQADIVQSTELAPDNLRLKLAIFNVTSIYKDWTAPYDAISCVGLAVSRQCWMETGFGDVEMSEDHYLGMIAREKSFRMAISGGQPLLHGHPYTLVGHIKRCFNEGMGAVGTGGYYSLPLLFHDLFSLARYRMALSAIFKYRQMRMVELAWIPIRHISRYIGWRFGKRYWR